MYVCLFHFWLNNNTMHIIIYAFLLYKVLVCTHIVAEIELHYVYQLKTNVEI